VPFVPQVNDHRSIDRDIAGYYDRNTRKFLRFSRGGALHRKLWPPEVHSKTESLLYVNRIILGSLEKVLGNLTVLQESREGGEKRIRIIDLGCGVGGTVLWLAEHMDAEFFGITLSPVQVVIANERTVRQGLAKRCLFQTGNILDVQQPDGSFHGAVAVESFSHVESAGNFFEQVSRLLVEGGVLVLIDDVRDEAGECGPRSVRWIRRFERGWHLHGLTTVDCIVSCALRSGLTLIENRDLTSLIRVHPSVMYLLSPLLFVPVPLYFLDSLRGGIALQFCTKRGCIRYRCMTFRKE
jgi:SAM-dependent methyltransferase